MISAIIVDDEIAASQAMKKLLVQNCRQVEVLKICNSPFEGLSAIQELNPALLFLDIEMPGMSGFEMLEKIKDANIEVIFTTAFNQYAIRAIQFSALDYLLKPVLAEHLISAIARFEIKKKSTQSLEQMKLLFENLKNPKPHLHRLAIPTFEGLTLLDLQDVVRLEADGSYTRFFSGKSQYLVSKSLKEYDDLLTENDFIRVHHGHLINLHYVSRFVKSDGGYLIMKDGSNVPVSARKKTEVLERLAHF